MGNASCAGLSDQDAAILLKLPLQISVPCDRRRLRSEDRQLLARIDAMHAVRLCRRVLMDRNGLHAVIEVELTALGVAELAFWRGRQARAQAPRARRPSGL